MLDRALDRDVDELAGIAVSLLSLKGRLRLAAHDEAAAREHLTAASCQPGAALPPDCGLFLRITSVLSEQPQALTMGELSRALQVPLSTATRVVDWQVAHGYLQRLPDPRDRRLVRVALSDDGRALSLHISTMLREKIRRLAGAFTSDERSSFIALLRKLVAVLTELEPPRSPAPSESEVTGA